MIKWIKKLFSKLRTVWKPQSFNARMRQIGYKGRFGRKVVRAMLRRERGYKPGTLGPSWIAEKRKFTPQYNV